MDNLLPVLRQFVRDLEGKVAVLERENNQLKQKNKSYEEQINEQKKQTENLKKDFLSGLAEYETEKEQLLKDKENQIKTMESKNLEEKECIRMQHEKEMEEEFKKIEILEKELKKEKDGLIGAMDKLKNEQSSNQTLKKEIRILKEEVITDLEEQITSHETKRKKTNNELRIAKERIMVLEEETLVQEQQKVVSLTKKLLQEEEKVRVEIEKNVQAMVDIQTCNDTIHMLKNDLCTEEQNNKNIIRKMEKEHEHAIQMMKEEQDQGKKSFEDEMKKQMQETECRFNEMKAMHEKEVTELEQEKAMIHNELEETLDIKEELEHTIIELSNKCDLLVNSCKEMESTIQDLQDEKEEVIHNTTLEKENYIKQYTDNINECERTIQSKTNEIQTLQTLLDEQTKQHSFEKKSYDEMIIEMEYFIHNISKRLEITSTNIAYMADEHTTMNRKMMDFYHRFRHNQQNKNSHYPFPSKFTSPSQQQQNNSGVKLLEYNNRMASCSFDEQIDSDTRNNSNEQPHYDIAQNMTHDSENTLELYES